MRMKHEIRNKVVDKHVLSLWKEGWHVGNIAHIAQVSQALVREILQDNNVKEIR